MANTHIYLEGDTRLGGELKSLIERMKDIYADCQNLMEIMAAIDHDGEDWSDLAAELGFTGEDASAHAQTAYNLIAYAWSYAINQEYYEHLITMMG